MNERYSSRLKREFFKTDETEWLVWKEPSTSKVVAFQVILTGPSAFLEWRPDKGLRWGRQDDGEVTGRHKMSPVLSPGSGSLEEVRRRVLAVLDVLPTSCPLSGELRAFMAERLRETPGPTAGDRRA